MKIIDLTVPITIKAEIEIDRYHLAELGLDDHTDFFEKNDLFSLRKNPELFYAITEIVLKEVNEILGTSDFFFREATTQMSVNFMEDHIKEVM